jgi:hypothetical protein
MFGESKGTVSGVLAYFLKNSEPYLEGLSNKLNIR